MNFNLALSIMAPIFLAYGIVALIAPGFVLNLVWPNPPGPEVNMWARGWAACLTAFGVLAWGARSLTDPSARRLVALTNLVYCSLALVAWLVDASTRGWALFGVMTFAIILSWGLACGYFYFGNPKVLLQGTNSR